MEMTIPVPKLASTAFAKEDHVDYDGVFLMTSVQKFLIEKDKDEDVTELASPSGDLAVSERGTWITLTAS